jgi:hypothetical protein
MPGKRRKLTLCAVAMIDGIEAPMNQKSGRNDLTVESFLVLRNYFFSRGPKPKPFQLRDKRNTQDDPLDEYISKVLHFLVRA